jgi:isoleucyl-tRNA synthetase
LRKRNLLFKEERIIHPYPLCYRCETPLIYRAQDSWFIDIQKIKHRLLEKNQNIHWVPEHFKNGRFAQGLETAPDWGISRTRYWATAMPVWECDRCQNREVFGSIQEIEERSTQKVRDLHRPFIDEIVFECLKCSGQMIRVKDVLDCWMESGSMPYAERHYPFENKAEFEKSFPADYISEYTGQVRAWFYVLHALSVALFDSHCFKNVVVSGVIMGTDGRKMSKSLNNFPDPRQVIEKYGGDALRLYLMGSPTMAGEDMNIFEEGIRDQLRSVLLLLWNCYSFFTTFASLPGFDPDTVSIDQPRDALDRWILSRANRFLKNFTDCLDDYRIPDAVRLLPEFLDNLSRWYIRRSRHRFKAGDSLALKTLYRVLVLLIKTTAPLIPFVTEKIYQDLVGDKESVHLEDWPKVDEEYLDDNLEEKMALVRQICSLGHAARKRAGIKIRQPLSKLKVKSEKLKALDNELLVLIKEELNVKEVVFDSTIENEVELETALTVELAEEGRAREFIRLIQAERKKLGLKPSDKIIIIVSGPENLMGAIEKHQSKIRREVIAENLTVELVGEEIVLKVKKK